MRFRTGMVNGIVAVLSVVPLACGPGPQPSAKPAGQARAADRAPLEVAQRIGGPGGTLVARLSNGMTVIIRPVHTSPVVCVQCYVKAGSMHEGRWLGCGLSHLVEHLVMDGTVHGRGAEARQVHETWPRVLAFGGQSNAYTARDHTYYTISSASTNTMGCIDLVADWMARAAIPREDFEREHGVVQRELEADADDADMVMLNGARQNVFRDHPAAVPIIGYKAPLARIAYEDVLAYRKKMYVPQNMVFVVVGDVDADKALRRCREAFAGFQAARTPDLSLPPVKPIHGLRQLTTGFKEAKETQGRICFQTVPLLHEDQYALDVLSFILGRDESGRLVQEVQRRQRLVTSIRASSWTPHWGKGVLTISYRCQPDKVVQAEEAIGAELRKVCDQGVTEAQLARAKRQTLAQMVFSLQSVDGIAESLALGYLETGNANYDRNCVERIQRVTADEVRRAARKYFDFENLAVTRVVPAKTFTTALASSDRARQARASAFVLPNGLRVVLVPTDAPRLVSMAFVTAGGLLLEDPKTNGLGMLMARVSTKGAGKRSAKDVIDFFAEAGGGLSGGCERDNLYWQASVLDDRFDTALEIFADTIQRPALPKDELAIAAPALKAEILRQKTDVVDELFLFFQSRFFAGSPYAMAPIGSAKAVDSATVRQLADHHATCLKGSSSVLAIYGRFDPATTRKRIEALFGRLPGGKTKLPDPTPRKVARSGEFHLLPTRKANAGVLVAVPGMKIDNLRDRFAIDVLDTILSGYELPAGWLFEELRGKKLVYHVHAYSRAGLAKGALLAYAVCEPDRAPTVVEIIKRSFRKAAAYKPTQEEVTRAINEILTAELLNNQTLADLAMKSALAEMHGLGHDFPRKLESHYREVTPEEVLRVARKYLGGGYVVVVTTPKPELFPSKAAGGR